MIMYQKVIKRAFDIIFSVIGILIDIIPMIIGSIIINQDSPVPAI